MRIILAYIRALNKLYLRYVRSYVIRMLLDKIHVRVYYAYLLF